MVFGFQYIHVSIFIFILITHNSQFLTQFIIPFLFFFYSPLKFLFGTQTWTQFLVCKKQNKTQTMGTMSKQLPNTHISSTHEPNKEMKKAKVKREREKNEERICIVSIKTSSVHRAPFFYAFSKVAQKVVVQNFSFLLFYFY